MLTDSSLARVVAWHKVAIAAAGCWSALVGLVPLACLIIPVHSATSDPNQNVRLIPPVSYERASVVKALAENVVLASPPIVQPEPVKEAPVALAAVVANEAKPVPVAEKAAVCDPADPGKCVACQEGPANAGVNTYGTAIKFNGNPLQAADEAGRDKRLVFVLHISGNFEDDRFT